MRSRLTMKLRIGRLLYVVLPALLVSGLTACTIFAPMQQPRSDRLALSATPGRAFVPCVPRDERSDECLAAGAQPDDSAGGLALALWELDERRRELNGYVVDRGNLTSTYNALLWPVGAHLINKKYRDRNWSVRDATAVAIASWGLLNSGVSDRDKLYLGAAGEMLCVWAAALPDLQAASEVDPRWREGDPAVGVVRPDSLLARIQELAEAIDRFDRRRLEIVVDLQRKPPPAAPGGNWVDRRVREARGEGSGTPRAVEDPVNGFTGTTEAALGAARAELRRLREAQGRILRAATVVRVKRTRIESALVRAISDRVELKNPFDVAREINGIIEQKLAAEKRMQDELAKAEGGRRAPLQAWLPTEERLRALKDAGAVKAFWTNEMRQLDAARQGARDWLTDDASRREEAEQVAKEVGCDGGSLAAFAASLLKPLAPPASGPAGTATDAPKPNVEQLK